MELFDIFATGHSMDCDVPLRDPLSFDRAAKNTNTDHRLLIAKRGKWVEATQSEWDVVMDRRRK
jgi:hypothetical protein